MDLKLNTYRLSQIFIYPIKSLGGIALNEAVVEDRGLQYDRRWMLVDAQGQFLTQRTFAGMALLQVQLTPEGLQVRHQGKPEMPSLHISFAPDASNPTQVVVWDDHCAALEVSPAANEWFSRALEVDCRLVYMPDDTRRQVDLNYAEAGDITSFSDGFPILMVGEASLADLNSRLKQPVPINRFRPNLVFTGGAPFEEDNWDHFKIGINPYRAVKPCGRCVVTTIDQQTAKKGKEPLQTLATYRQHGSKVLFGQNVLPRAAGQTLSVGDPITVLSWRA